MALVRTLIDRDQDHLGPALPAGLRELYDADLHRRLPVIERSEPARVMGYPGRQGIMAARLRRLDEEHVRELGWARRFSGRRPVP